MITETPAATKSPLQQFNDLLRSELCEFRQRNNLCREAQSTPHRDLNLGAVPSEAGSYVNVPISGTVTIPRRDLSYYTSHDGPVSSTLTVHDIIVDVATLNKPHTVALADIDLTDPEVQARQAQVREYALRMLNEGYDVTVDQLNVSLGNLGIAPLVSKFFQFEVPLRQEFTVAKYEVLAESEEEASQQVLAAIKADIDGEEIARGTISSNEIVPDGTAKPLLLGWSDSPLKDGGGDDD